TAWEGFPALDAPAFCPHDAAHAIAVLLLSEEGAQARHDFTLRRAFERLSRNQQLHTSALQLAVDHVEVGHHTAGHAVHDDDYQYIKLSAPSRSEQCVKLAARVWVARTLRIATHIALINHDIRQRGEVGPAGGLLRGEAVLIVSCLVL